jgi:hypothetical protein
MFVEDFSLYTKAFGVPCTLDGQDVTAIFDDRHAEGFDDVLTCNHPRISLPAADASSAVRGSVVVIDGVTYSVGAIQPDGTGWTVLTLHNA